MLVNAAEKDSGDCESLYRWAEIMYCIFGDMITTLALLSLLLSFM